MKIFSLILLLFLISFATFSATEAEIARRAELAVIIDEELQEVIRLNKQTKGQRPELLLRMSELLLEKGRLIKEDEVDAYLKVASAQRSDVKKEQFFKNSTNYFMKADKICLLIVKRFPSFKYIADVYYVLAFDAKEFNRNDVAKKYFQKVMKSTAPGNKTYDRSALALAEIHFNEHNYKEATPLYERMLSHKEKSRWWTKDSYNLAWCYFYLKRYSQAISTMQQVQEMSVRKEFVDMSREVEKYMGYFYVESGQTEKAIEFYENKSGDVSKNLINLSKLLIDKSNYKMAENLLLQALKKSDEVENQKNGLFTMLNLYEKTINFEKHIGILKQLVPLHEKGVLDKSEAELLKFSLEKNGALLQRQVINGEYSHRPKDRIIRTKLAVEYFNLNGVLLPEKKHSYFFNSAETLFAVGKYSESLSYYDLAIKQSTIVKDRKILKLAYAGLVAAIDQKTVSQEEKDKYTTQVYDAVLKEDPKSKKAFVIYQRLFSARYDKKEIEEAEKVLMEFKNNFPDAFSTQEAMLAKIMDYYKDKKDSAGIQKWVKRINNKEFVISSEYAKKLQILLVTMQFENVEQAHYSGDKKLALRGYLAIYKDKNSSEVARKNAAYNIAVLFHELGDTDRIFAWAQKSLSLMTADDVVKFEDSFLAFGAELFAKRRFKEALTIYETSFNLVCNKASKNKKLFFKNANVIYLTAKNILRARDFIEQSVRCELPSEYINEMRIELIKAASEMGEWPTFDKTKILLDANKDSWPEMIGLLALSHKRYILKGDSTSAKEERATIEKYYSYCVTKKLDVPLEGLDAVAGFKIMDMEQDIRELKSSKLQFPEQTFNTILKNKFTVLDKITAKAMDVLAVRSGKGIVKSYKYLVESYRYLVDEISSFTPEGKPEEYLVSFRKSMNNLIAPISKQANEYYAEAKNQIHKNNIVSEESAWFLKEEITNTSVDLEYSGQQEGILMDRGGVE